MPCQCILLFDLIIINEKNQPNKSKVIHQIVAAWRQFSAE